MDDISLGAYRASVVGLAAFALFLLSAVLYMLADSRNSQRLAAWAFIALVAVCLLATCSPAPAAPAPRERPVPPPPAIVPASVTMTWMSVRCETHFHVDGTFACRWMGGWWQGRWSQKGGVLSVEEWDVADPLRRCEWKVKLSSATAGHLLPGMSEWAVEPLGGVIR